LEVAELAEWRSMAVRARFIYKGPDEKQENWSLIIII
jgi:hypothetical protein